MSNQIVISSGAKVRSLEGVLTGTAGIVNALGINVPSGIPQLDGSGKILVSQLPNSVMEYKGSWNAATNTPTLVNGTGNAGDVYLCEVAGTVNFGAGPITFAVGDQVIYSGTIWQRASGATGTVTSVAVTESGDALTITGSPITTSGTINIGFAGTSGQYINGAGGLTTFPSLTGFVPYTGATANVDLGTFDLTTDIINLNQLKAIGSGGLNIYSNSGTHIALMGGGGGAGTTFYGGIIGTTGSFASSGGSDTFAINHSSGSGIALNITKGGAGEGLYINKTSGSGNAATIIGTLNATTLVKSGGTSSQFLKADGSVDSNTYLTSASAALGFVTLDTTQTITGDKTFSGVNVYNGVNVFNNFQTRFTAGIAINNTTSGGAVGSHTVIGANVSGLQVNLAAGGYNNLNFASTTVGNTYTFPNATGTIALTTDLNAYLPLTGGTLSGQLSILRGSGTGLEVASDLVVFRASTGFGSPRQITLAAGNGATTYLEAKGYGANYITDFGIRTYNSSGTAFEVFFATSAGNVGINNTAPSTKLDVNGTFNSVGAATFQSTLRINTAGQSLLIFPTTTSSVRMQIQSSGGGNMIIGTDNSSGGDLVSGSSAYASVFSSGSTRDLVLGTNSTARLTITGSSGNVFIGALPSNTSYLKFNCKLATDKHIGFNLNDNIASIETTNDAVSANVALQFVASSFKFQGLGTGTVTSTSGVLSAVSDMNLKIEDGYIDSALDKILKLTPRYFYWKEETGLPTDLRQLGFFAQEVNEALGEEAANSPKTEKDKWGIYDRAMIAMLTKAIQELKAEVDQLKNK
jgi:hypothetical protein